MKTLMQAFIALSLLIPFNSLADCTGEQIMKMMTAGFTKEEILQLCGKSPQTTPDASPQDPLKITTPIILNVPGVLLLKDVDFKNGSKTVYQANLSSWPRKKGQHGLAVPEGNSYALEATSNTWMGAGFVPLTPQLTSDFILNISFKVIHMEDCSLSITLSDSGTNYSQLNLFFDIWKSRGPTFSAYEYWVTDNFYSNLKRKFAERQPVPDMKAQVNWNSINTLSIKREGVTISYYLNKRLLQSFSASLFTVRRLSTSLAFRSKVVLTSVNAKVPK